MDKTKALPIDLGTEQNWLNCSKLTKRGMVPLIMSTSIFLLPYLEQNFEDTGAMYQDSS